jgi:D-glycero-D-manno-heptose 1,7-bisphosphate phosphatase
MTVATPSVLFLDRDGVLNAKASEGSYVTSPAEFRWLPGAVDALAAITSSGVRLIVVTNQRGVAQGLMTDDDLTAVHGRMCDELADVGVALLGIYACTHDLGRCDCRKPEVGLFTRALREHPDIELADSAVVGDGMSDMLAAARLAIPAYAIVDDASRAEFERAAREHGAAIGGSFPSLAALVRDGLGIEAA